MPGTEDHRHQFYGQIKIDGRSLAPADTAGLLDCTVENSLHLPSACSIRIAHPELEWLSREVYKIGASVEVLFGPEDGSLTPVFKGELIGLDLDIVAPSVPTIVLRAMDKGHRLHRGRKQAAWVNVSDADIVKKVAAQAGLTAVTNEVGTVHEWMLQYNQTDWEFLSERALSCGCRLYIKEGDKLQFEKVASSGGREVPVTWGDDLRTLRLRVSATTQVAGVEVRGWDPKTKQAIIGKAQSANGLPQVSDNDGKAASNRFGDAQMVVVDRPVHSVKEAELLATSLLDEISASYLEAEGLLYGVPQLLSGDVLVVKQVGSRYSGKYLVTAVTHSYVPNEGFTTQFSATGKTPNVMMSLLGSSQSRMHDPRMGGNIVIGIVTNNKDTEGMGRVKVKYPWLTESLESHWVRIASSMGGAERGFYFLPEVNDEVLVAFEHGDPRRPYVLGGLWNGKDKPIEPNSTAVNDEGVIHRIIKTRIGHTILLDDENKKGMIQLKALSGHVMTLNDKEEQIQAKTKNGHLVTLDDRNDKIEIIDKTGGNKVTINSRDNSIKMECKGNFSVEATGKVSIKGTAGVAIETPAQMSLKSSGPATLESSSMLDVKSSGITNIKGSLVNIN